MQVFLPEEMARPASQPCFLFLCQAAPEDALKVMPHPLSPPGGQLRDMQTQVQVDRAKSLGMLQESLGVLLS